MWEEKGYIWGWWSVVSAFDYCNNAIWHWKTKPYINSNKLFGLSLAFTDLDLTFTTPPPPYHSLKYICIFVCFVILFYLERMNLSYLAWFLSTSLSFKGSVFFFTSKFTKLDINFFTSSFYFILFVRQNKSFFSSVPKKILITVKKN